MKEFPISKNNINFDNNLRIGIAIGQLNHGGAETQTAILAKGLLETRRLQPVVFCLSSATYPNGDALRVAGVPLYVVEDGVKPGFPKLRWLARQLRQTQCDLVFGVLHIGNIYAGAAALMGGLPLITSIRNAEEVLSRVIRAMSGYFLRRSACVIANSPSCVTSLREDFAVRHQRVLLIPNAIPSRKTSPDAKARLRREFGIPFDATLIGTVALLKLQKRPEFFIEVCKELYRLESACLPSKPYFVWIGDGPERERVVAMLAVLPADLARRIHFTGARTNISDCLAAMDVFVLTSAYEGMPNALMEAMAARLPCIATDVAGTRDLIAGVPPGVEIGALASAGDPQAFAAELLALLQEPDRMHAMGTAARSHIQEVYTTGKMIQAYQDVFTRVLEAPKSRKGWL